MDDAVRAEVNNYLQLKVDATVDDDPLLFWRNAQQLDQFKRVAKMVLTRSASSVDVECMFSTTGLILNGKRSSLGAQSADKLSFIHAEFVRILDSLGILISYFPGPGKSWNHCMVMESPGKGPGICWAVLEKNKIK